MDIGLLGLETKSMYYEVRKIDFFPVYILLQHHKPRTHNMIVMMMTASQQEASLYASMHTTTAQSDSFAELLVVSITQFVDFMYIVARFLERGGWTG